MSMADIWTQDLWIWIWLLHHLANSPLMYNQFLEKQCWVDTKGLETEGFVYKQIIFMCFDPPLFIEWKWNHIVPFARMVTQQQLISFHLETNPGNLKHHFSQIIFQKYEPSRESYIEWGPGDTVIKYQYGNCHVIKGPQK